MPAVQYQKIHPDDLDGMAAKVNEAVEIVNLRYPEKYSWTWVKPESNTFAKDIISSVETLVNNMVSDTHVYCETNNTQIKATMYSGNNSSKNKTVYDSKTTGYKYSTKNGTFYNMAYGQD